MSMSVPLALMALASFQQTDTTFSVSPTARLDLKNHAGTIVVTTWGLGYPLSLAGRCPGSD